MANKEVLTTNESEGEDSQTLLYQLSDILDLDIQTRNLPPKLLMDETILRTMGLPRFEDMATFRPNAEEIVGFLHAQYAKGNRVAIRAIHNEFGSLGGYTTIFPSSFEEAGNSFIEEEGTLWMVSKATTDAASFVGTNRKELIALLPHYLIDIHGRPPGEVYNVRGFEQIQNNLQVTEGAVALGGGFRIFFEDISFDEEGDTIVTLSGFVSLNNAGSREDAKVPRTKFRQAYRYKQGSLVTNAIPDTKTIIETPDETVSADLYAEKVIKTVIHLYGDRLTPLFAGLLVQEPGLHRYSIEGHHRLVDKKLNLPPETTIHEEGDKQVHVECTGLDGIKWDQENVLNAQRNQSAKTALQNIHITGLPRNMNPAARNFFMDGMRGLIDQRWVHKGQEHPLVVWRRKRQKVT